MRNLTVIIILILVASSSDAISAEKTTPQATGKYNALILNGEIIANEISKATGCVFSPILGISVLGAYTYYTTPIAERGSVPWHAEPAFWVPLLIVLLGIILKDSSKIALPKILVMPLDAIETLLEKNVSAVLGLLVILSSITGRALDQVQLAVHIPGFSLTASAHAAENLSTVGAASSGGIVELAFLYVLVTVVFGLVWMVSQSFNFLIFLCPFSWLDLSLAMLKNAVVALLVGSYLIHPFLGLLVSCVIILLSLFLFAKSYRFVIFGTIFSADILFTRSRRHEIESPRIKAFAGSFLDDVPPLSYGTLTTENSLLVFHYRPWLFLPARSVSTSYTCAECDVGIGTLSPVIITSGTHFETEMTLFRLRPLYSSREERVVALLGLKGVRDVTIGNSIKERYRWLVEQLGFSTRKHHNPM